MGAPVASLVARDVAVNTAIPARTVRWAPNTSATRPPSSISPPKHRVYEVTTQVSACLPRSRSVAHGDSSKRAIRKGEVRPGRDELRTSPVE